MKVKRMLLFALVCGVVILPAIAANADTFTATVDQAAIDAEKGTVFIALTLVSMTSGTSWTGSKWFYVSGAHSRSVLAMALTALTGSHDVYISSTNTNVSPPVYPQILGFFCLK